MLCKDIDSADNSIHLKEFSFNFNSKQNLNNVFYFLKNGRERRQFYFKKKKSKIGLWNLQIIDKKHITKEEKSNFRYENSIFKRKIFQQTNIKKKKSKTLQCMIKGGGCGSSKFQIKNPQKIIFNEKPGILDKRFMQNYEDFTDKKQIAENIQYERQGGMQVDIIQCLKLSNIHIRRNIVMYKPKLMKLIDVYLIYVLTGSSQKEVLKQSEIKELGSLLKDMKESFEMESQDQPSCDLIFVFDILYRFNSKRVGKDEQNKNQLIQAVDFITTIVKLGAGVLATIGGNFMEGINLTLQGTKYLLQQYEQSKSNQVFYYLLDIWVRKTIQFQDRIWDLTLSQELQFYITIFNEQCSKKDYETDFVLLTLIKIDYYFSLVLENEDGLKNLNQNLSLNSELIKFFIPMLIQKNNSKSILDEIESLLKFTVQNHTYRFLTISILLKYNKIIKDTNDFQGYKENIKVYLSYKYLCEKNKSVKLAFETSKEFVEYFNSKIQQEQFQSKIIQLSKERSKSLKSLLEGYEEKIDNSQDIERMIANIIIDKWERDVKRRQQDDIAQKDDILLEVKDLYIQQSITYLEGSNILQPNQSLSKISEENQKFQRQNALQQILDNFLSGNVKTKETPNIKISNNERYARCKILGILAEGGAGKSMFIKKLETHLIVSANSNTEKPNYIPLLIKCSYLDPVSPSIENYLLAQGVEQQQINIIKQSDRNKVILLDGYDEFTGEYFRVYQQLNLHTWKNTKVIVTSRNEQLELSDACVKFSLEGDNGLRDENSYCIVKLEEFTHKDILEYCKVYFKQHRTIGEQLDEQLYQNDMEVILDFMKNRSLENLLYLPINLYLFTRMIVQIKDKTEIQKIKESISNQIGIQEIFFNEQFKREAQDFVQAQLKESSNINNDFSKLIAYSFFEYFQSISMKMFLNKGKQEINNFLQIRKDKIEFKLQNQIENELSEKEKNILLEKIINYVNSKIITRSIQEIDISLSNRIQNKSYVIEFKHKSLFEYFVARAMKYDFDVHGDNIYKLTIEQLKEFNINKKYIMNSEQNQSEQWILIKLYQMIKNEIESDEFYSTYHLEQIEKNSRYIQYIKKSTIKRNEETSQIDIGASNMLSALFVSKFAFSNLQLSFCSFSKLYVFIQKSDQINFENCNLQNSYLKNLHINYDSCNTQLATFDAYQKVFDTSNIFSFNQIIWDKKNVLYAITKSGFINAFKIEKQNILLQKSKQLSQTSLSQMLAINNENLLISSQYSLLLINSNSFELLQSYKFKNVINSITLIKENIFVTFKSGIIFQGSLKNGFRKLNIIGTGCVYNEQKQILLVYSSGSFSLYNAQEKFKLIKTIKGHDDDINSVAFSTDGKYLATGSSDSSCKIWHAEKDFGLINTIQGHTSKVISVVFSPNGKYLATGQYQNCKIWNVEKGFELINTIQDHTSYISSVAFSTDSKYLATGSNDNTCKIWSVEKGFEFVNAIQGHTDWVQSVAFSADGKYLVTGSSDKTCKIWNVQKGFGLINTIQGHDEAIRSIAFSVDGKYLATGSNDRSCKIWNVEKDFELINTIQSHTEAVRSVAFSKDGKYLATGSRYPDCSCKIWITEKGFELINTIQGHVGSIFSIAFSADGKFLATGSKDNTCKIWNADKAFELINTIKDHDGSIFSVAFSGDRKYLATSSQDKTCKIWNVEKGFELINTIQGHTDQINSVAFSTDGKYLATGSDYNTCKIWNIEKGFELINTIQDHDGSIFSVAFSTDGKYLTTGSSDKTCKIWNAEKGFEIINTIQNYTEAVRSVAFSADGKYLAAGYNDNTCKIWNAEKGFELINTISGHTEAVRSVTFSSDGKYLVTGSSDKTCKIWNVEKGFEIVNTILGHQLATGSKDTTCKIWDSEKSFILINTVQGHTDQINSVAFSTDGKYLATCSSDKTCKIWNVEKGFELINTIQDHTDAVRSVAFSTDGKYLTTGSNDNTCKIWDIEQGFKLINTIQDHDGSIFTVTFSSNGKYLATSSSDKTCMIWNVEKDFELINIIQDHDGIIFSVVFSADGKYLATGSNDNTCKIWKTEKGFEMINTIQGHQSDINSFAFSADGKYLATGSQDKTCKIWNTEKDFKLINTIQGHASGIFLVAFSANGKYICIENNDKSQNIYDLQNFKKVNELNKQENLQEKFQFKQNEINEFKKMRIFENMYIL